MISIMKHLELLTDDVNQLLAETAEELWGELNPRGVGGSYLARSLVARVKNFRSELEKQEYIALVGDKVATRQRKYIDYISDESVLKHIITAPPLELDKIIANAQAIIRPADLFTIVDGKVHVLSFGNRLLSNVFTYRNYRGSDLCVNRYIKLGFNNASCPYCNDTKLKIVPIAEEHKVDKKMLFDIDHFYSQKKYPYLALSFYNHIPSCQPCNQHFKGETEFTLSTHIHPYDRCFDTLYNFQLNHGVLIGEPPNLVGIRKKSIFNDELVTDLKIKDRYKENFEPARIDYLISILANYSHILRGGIENADDQAILKQRLNDFGVIYNQNEMLKRDHSKFLRDTIAIFDPNNALGLT